jgi:cell division septal protein FtsQ
MNENTQSKPRPIFAVKNRRKIWFFLIPIIAVIIGLVIWAVWFSSIFAVDQVRAVNANDSELTQQQVMEIRAKAGVTAGDPIALVDADTAAREVAELPLVQSVEIRRGWPNEIVIAVETRTPVAKVSTGVGELAVDSSGNTFESADINGLPRIDAEGDALIAAVEPEPCQNLAVGLMFKTSTMANTSA